MVPHGDGRVPRFEEELRHFQRCVRVGHPHVQGQPTSVVLGLEGHRSLLDEELDDVQQHLLVLVLPPLVVLQRHMERKTTHVIPNLESFGSRPDQQLSHVQGREFRHEIDVQGEPSLVVPHLNGVRPRRDEEGRLVQRLVLGGERGVQREAALVVLDAHRFGARVEKGLELGPRRVQVQGHLSLAILQLEGRGILFGKERDGTDFVVPYRDDRRWIGVRPSWSRSRVDSGHASTRNRTTSAASWTVRRSVPTATAM